MKWGGRRTRTVEVGKDWTEPMNSHASDEIKLNAFFTRALGDLSAGYGGVMVSLGSRLGLYRGMSGAGPITPGELATRTGCAERYVREWLNAQAAGGHVVYHPSSGTYELPPEQALVLTDEDSPMFIPNAWQVPASMWFDEGTAIEAFRTGSGVAWGDHDARLHCGAATFFRNAYRGSLLAEWLSALDGVVDRLHEGIAVADVGCGHGHSTILMAKAFPNSRFYGFDANPASIEAAGRNAAEAGVKSRVQFQVASSADYPENNYGLICFFDCLHDMGNPVTAARYAGEVLAPGGTVMVIEPFANDRVEDELRRLHHAVLRPCCIRRRTSRPGRPGRPGASCRRVPQGGFLSLPPGH